MRPFGVQERKAQKQPRLGGSHPRGTERTRMVAVLALIPSVPLLLISVAALALFYLAPLRFGNLLARLPGDSYLQTALFFAPSILFAIVVLAFLYAIEKPEIARTRPQRAASGMSRSKELAPGLQINTQVAAQRSLLLAVPLLLFSGAVRVVEFLAPDRSANFIARLPGDTYLRPLIAAAPWVLLLLVMGLIYWASRNDRPPLNQNQGQTAEFSSSLSAGPTRVTVGMVLVTSAMMLLFSLAALLLYYLTPDRFLGWVSRLPQEAILRAGLVFVPGSLLVVVLLGALYLYSRRVDRKARAGLLGVQFDKRLPLYQSIRQAALWGLVGGLVIGVAAASAILGALVYLIL
jgi:hypothetical protein